MALLKMNFEKPSASVRNIKYIKYRPKVINFSDFSTTPLKLMELGGRDLYLRYNASYSSNSGIGEIVSIKDDGTESIVYVGAYLATAAYADAFKIYDVKRINKWSAWLIGQMMYSTTNNQIYPCTLFYISICSDGTLQKSQNYGTGTNITNVISDAAGGNISSDPIIVPGLWGTASCQELRMGCINTLRSSGGHNIYFLQYALNDWKGTASSPNSNPHSININDGNVNNYLPDLTIVNARGGIFWKYGGSSYTEQTAPYIELFYGTGLGGYGSGAYKYAQLRNADTSGKLQSLGVINHYVVGMTSNDIIVTTQIDMTDPTKYVYHFYLWNTFANTTAQNYTNFMVPYEMSEYDTVIEKPAGTRLLCFVNDIITFSDLTRYQVLPANHIITQVDSIQKEVEYDVGVYHTADEIGPESDPFNGIFIYGG